MGFPGTCDGFLHRERYNSRGSGLLDMFDPFKFADREELLVVAVNDGITWTHFRLERDRRGLTFYYPASTGRAILDRAGADADESVVWYQNQRFHLTEAFRESASGLLQMLDGKVQGPIRPEPFIFLVPGAQ